MAGFPLVLGHLWAAGMSDRSPKTMTIPEVRDRLYELGSEIGLPELFKLADQLWRRQPGRPRAPVQHRRVTPELKAQIRAFAAEHPEMSEDKIGVRFGVNQGRVSEALFGFRGES
jgi:hypothetical protein